jgi:hypothetical protein
MAWFARMAILLVLLLTVTGAGSPYGADGGPPAAYPYRHSAFDFSTVWKTTPAGQGIAIEGLLKNVRYAFVDDLEMTVALRNKDNKLLAKETTFLTPQPLRNGEARPFSLNLRNVAISPGDVLQFSIKCRVDEGRDESFIWLSSFEVDAATGAAMDGEGRTPADL